jgi:hypothetical protein
LEKRAEQVLPGSEGVGGRGRGLGTRGRNGPSNNVCTHEYMNKEKKSIASQKKKKLPPFPNNLYTLTGTFLQIQYELNYCLM